MDKYFSTNHITIHALEYAGGEPTLIFLPGLTANAHSFTAVAPQLAPQNRVLALDLRGRGQSSKPTTGYTLADHAADVLGILDTAGIQQATLIGHSFGGLLSLYLAARHPQRVARMVLIDAALSAASKEVGEMIRPSLARLGVTLPSVQAYLDAMRQMPFLHGQWDADIEAYFRADMHINPDGSARPHSTPAAINAVIDGILAEDWANIATQITCPTLLLNATEPYGPPGSPPIITAAQAQETVAQLAHAQYQHTPGNHVTMLFGPHAAPIAQAIQQFVIRDA
jgi:pimeloyl-ACP methyl ester carboxylesterase